MPTSTSQPAVQIDNQGRTRNADTFTKKSGLDSSDFQATLLSTNAPATYFAAKYADGANTDVQPAAAAVTSATINRVAGASNGYGYGAPYLGLPAGTASGNGAAMATVNDGFAPGGPGNYAGVPGGTSPSGMPGDTSGSGFSSDYYEKRSLLTQMNDSNWQMLLLQNDVQNINREYTTFSNIYSVRHQTDMNMLRNMGKAA